MIPETSKEIFRYPTLDGHHTAIVRDASGAELRYLVNEETGEYRIIRPYTFEVATANAITDLHKMGFTNAYIAAKELISLFERSGNEKTLRGRELYSDTVEYEGRTLLVTIQIRKRQLAQVYDCLYRHISKHSVERAKERWGIDLTIDYVELIIKEMDAGRYKKHAENKDCITVTLTVAQEDISIVYDPKSKQIVTFIPNKNVSEIF